MASISWREGPIDGCRIRPLRAFDDARGWLAEFFRRDELEAELHPAMGYISVTRAGVTRGPHEHADQTDLFLFFDGLFRVVLWDVRSESPTYGHRWSEELGSDRKAVVIIPPGVVHAYRNVGTDEAAIINCPNRLYAGEGKREDVDEIRHEDVADSPFRLD